MIIPNRKALWSTAAVLVLGGTAVLLAQGVSDNADNSLAALTSEVRQLRLAVEESTRNQTQTQALAVYLSAQQSRMVQVASQLDSVRRELDAAMLRSRNISASLQGIQTRLLQETDREKRSQLEDASLALKAEQANVGFQEQQARARESELSQTLQRDQSRWNDLISTLEQLIKR